MFSLVVFPSHVQVGLSLYCLKVNIKESESSINLTFNQNMVK